MAHAIIEYSSNLEDKVDLEHLVDQIHDACIKTGVFPLTGMRTRTARRDTYKIADGNLEACFIHLQLKIGPGREDSIKKKAMEDIFGSLCSYVKPLYDTSPVALSIEILELPPVLRINKNNLKDYVITQEFKVTEDA
mgnify:CR=1 FL=1